MRAVTIAIAATSLAQMAGAQMASVRPSSASMDALAGCRAEVDPKVRLACFDRTAGAMIAARSRGEILVVDRAGVVQRKRARFGLPAGAGDAFGGGAEDRATAVMRLDTTIASARPVRGDRWNMELADGSIWQTVEPVRRTPAKGLAVKVVRASLGGYRAAIAGTRAVLVKRIR